MDRDFPMFYKVASYVIDGEETIRAVACDDITDWFVERRVFFKSRMSREIAENMIFESTASDWNYERIGGFAIFSSACKCKLYISFERGSFSASISKYGMKFTLGEWVGGKMLSMFPAVMDLVVTDEVAATT